MKLFVSRQGRARGKRLCASGARFDRGEDRANLAESERESQGKAYVDYSASVVVLRYSLVCILAFNKVPGVRVWPE